MEQFAAISENEGRTEMLKIGLCDDDAQELLKLRPMVETYLAKTRDMKAELVAFGSPEELMDDLEKNGAADIALLDIVMPGFSGIELAERIRRENEAAAIIFITSSRDFAVEAFALKAAHYIVKPFTEEKIADALARALEHFADAEPKRILLRLKNGIVRSVEVSQILYIESVGAVRTVTTKHGIFEETRKTLTEFSQELDGLCPGQFISPYRGYIVNQEAIETITVNEMRLSCGSRVPIKPNAYRAIRAAFFEWSFSRK